MCSSAKSLVEEHIFFFQAAAHEAEKKAAEEAPAEAAAEEKAAEEKAVEEAPVEAEPEEKALEEAPVEAEVEKMALAAPPEAPDGKLVPGQKVRLAVEDLVYKLRFGETATVKEVMGKTTRVLFEKALAASDVPTEFLETGPWKVSKPLRTFARVPQKN